MPTPAEPSPGPVSTLTGLWRSVERKAELYKRTRDPQMREQLAGLLWQAMVTEGQIIARKQLPLHHPHEPKDMAEDATASLLGKGMTLMLNKHEPDGNAQGRKAGLRTYLAAAISYKLRDYARKERWQQVAPPDRGAATLSPGAEAALEPDAHPLAKNPATTIEAALGQAEFWRIAKEELDPDRELPVLLAYLAGHPRKAGAALLGITDSVYKSRLEGLVTKLARRYNGAFGSQPDEDEAG